MEHATALLQTFAELVGEESKWKSLGIFGGALVVWSILVTSSWFLAFLVILSVAGIFGGLLHAVQTGIIKLYAEDQEREPAPKGAPSGASKESIRKFEALKAFKVSSLSQKDNGIDADTHEKRTFVAKEILDTEKSYVRWLNVIVDTYETPLRKALATEPIASEDDIKAIFFQIPVILNYNKQLLKDLEERMAKWGPKTKLGDVFVQFADYFKSYSPYTSNYNEAFKTLRKLNAENPRFREFISAIECSPQASLDLLSLLIMPVQRIPRYRLLLEQLIKRTPKQHPDYDDLVSALDKINRVTEIVDERVNEATKLHRIYELQKCLRPSKSYRELPEVLLPFRQLFHEGQLEEASVKVAGKPGRASRYALVYFLCTDVIYATKHKQTIKRKSVAPGEAIEPIEGHYKLKRVIELDSAEVSASPKSATKFTIEFEEMAAAGSRQSGVGTTTVELELEAPSKDERQVWVEKITQTKAQWRAHSDSFVLERQAVTARRALSNKQIIADKYGSL